MSGPMKSKRPPKMKEIGVRGNPGIGLDAYGAEDAQRLLDSQDAKMPRKKSSAPMTSKRPPKMKEIGVPGNPGINPKDNYSPEDFERLMDSQDAKMPQKFRDGGSVRGCKSGQMSGKGFSGSY